MSTHDEADRPADLPHAGAPSMPADDAPPRPGTHAIGHLEDDGTDEPDRLPTLEEFRAIARNRCREKLSATRTKALAASVYAVFGHAARPVLAEHFLAVAPDGTIRSGAEEEVDDDWVELVWVMHKVHGAALPLPCDTRVKATGCVEVVPHNHEAHDCGATKGATWQD